MEASRRSHLIQTKTFVNGTLGFILWIGLSISDVQSLSSFPIPSSSSSSNPSFFPAPIDNPTLSRQQQNQEHLLQDRQPLTIRIQSTTESDIRQGVSAIWAQALVEAEEVNNNRKATKTAGRGGLAWKLPRRFQSTKYQGAVERLLESRLRAIRAWEASADECVLEAERQGLDRVSEADQLRYIWSATNFKGYLEAAAQLSHEPHPWKAYNFHCTPSSAGSLHHKMMTAKDARSGEIVGFCEIATLLEPSVHETPPFDLNTKPTIVNLVVSSEHRRMGIASRLMESAEAYVSQHWEGSDSSPRELSLYVDKANHAALRLYENVGFERRMEVLRPSGKEAAVAQWYMSRPLNHGRLSLTRRHRERRHSNRIKPDGQTHSSSTEQATAIAQDLAASLI